MWEPFGTNDRTLAVNEHEAPAHPLQSANNSCWMIGVTTRDSDEEVDLYPPPQTDAAIL